LPALSPVEGRGPTGLLRPSPSLAHLRLRATVGKLGEGNKTETHTGMEPTSTHLRLWATVGKGGSLSVGLPREAPQERGEVGCVSFGPFLVGGDKKRTPEGEKKLHARTMTFFPGTAGEPFDLLPPSSAFGELRTGTQDRRPALVEEIVIDERKGKRILAAGNGKKGVDRGGNEPPLREKWMLFFLGQIVVSQYQG